ncbi:MAG: fibronectin type III domain-containing protein [Mediterranea sp.]|jgi:hypothetical protein|nr:fibronectin type III domain-containing protein [Mediterranea sp.]
MKTIKYIAFLGAALMFASACSDQSEEITTSVYDRLFSPTDLRGIVQGQTNIKFDWTAVRGAQSYVIELYHGDSEAGTLYKTVEGVTGTTWLVENLIGSTPYYCRVKAVGEGIGESLWSGYSISTAAEQIFLKVMETDVEANDATLKWDAKGNPVTRITLTPGDITYTLTDEDIANQLANIPGLTGETEYTADIYYDSSKRGTISFKTWIDSSSATLVNEGDDFKTMLDNGTEGQSFAFASASTFDIGNYSLKKSVRIFSASPSAKATITGRFTGSGSVVSSVRFAGVILDGAESQTNMVDINSAGSGISTLEFESCEIRNYTQRLMYNNNATASYGNVTFNNCLIDNIGAGGDALDFRNGTLATLSLTNTTISNGIRSFLRCQIKAEVSITNCTFYNICTVADSNNSGLFRMNNAEGTLTVGQSIFYGIGSDALVGTTQGVWARSGNINATTNYSQNYYFSSPNLWGGMYADNSSAVATELDPKFVDAAGGDFTIQAEDMIYAKIGDPRWIQ